jgi:hypothetical protein
MPPGWVLKANEAYLEGWHDATMQNGVPGAYWREFRKMSKRRDEAGIHFSPDLSSRLLPRIT